MMRNPSRLVAVLLFLAGLANYAYRVNHSRASEVLGQNQADQRGGGIDNPERNTNATDGKTIVRGTTARVAFKRRK
jgi:hypothetical protein